MLKSTGGPCVSLASWAALHGIMRRHDQMRRTWVKMVLGTFAETKACPEPGRRRLRLPGRDPAKELSIDTHHLLRHAEIHV